MVPKINGKKFDLCAVETKEGIVFIKPLAELAVLRSGLLLSKAEVSINNKILTITGFTIIVADFRNWPRKKRRIKTTSDFDEFTKRLIRPDFYTEEGRFFKQKYIKPEVFLYKQHDTLVLTTSNWVFEELYQGMVDVTKLDDPSPASPPQFKNPGLITF